MSEALPLWKYVVAGGSAGVMEITMMYPTDVMKTRAQLSTESVSMISTFRSILQTQGVSGLYRGITSPILAEAPKRAWKFSSNEKFKQGFRETHPDGKLTIAAGSASGALAGITEALINCPFETVKVRMQSTEFVSKFKTTTDCLMYLLKNEGVTSVYKGIEPQMWRNGMWNGAYFGIIGYVGATRAAMERPPQTKSEKLFEKFITGAGASSIGCLCNTPFDVVKSRMQMQAAPVAGEAVKYRHAWQSLGVVLREEGFAALYKGLGPRLVRLGPGGGIMIICFDFITGLLKDF